MRETASLRSGLCIIPNISTFLMDNAYECLVVCATFTQNGDLPVHLAAWNGHLELVKYLLDLQPDTISAKNGVSCAISILDSP